MNVIEVQNVYKYYGNQVALDGVSLTVGKGEIFGLIGPNGAGKTTLVESIAGLRQADQGHIRVLGLDPRQQRNVLRARVGIQLQANQLPDKIKVWEALDMYSAFYEQAADWEALITSLGLSDKRNTRFEELSGGQKQRLSVALALVGNPELLILDELTTGLDPDARRKIWALILEVRARGVTIVLVSHFMDEAERLCDRVAMLKQGRVVALDTPARIVAQVGASLEIKQPSLDDAFIVLTQKKEQTTFAGGPAV